MWIRIPFLQMVFCHFQFHSVSQSVKIPVCFLIIWDPCFNKTTQSTNTIDGRTNEWTNEKNKTHEKFKCKDVVSYLLIKLKVQLKSSSALSDPFIYVKRAYNQRNDDNDDDNNNNADDAADWMENS